MIDSLPSNLQELEFESQQAKGDFFFFRFLQPLEADAWEATPIK
jgi:hypothetical protein